MSKWLSVLQLVVPVVLSAINPALGALSPLIFHGISTAETMPNATGPQKLAAVVDLVNTGVAGVNTAAGKQIIDPTTVNTTASAIISAAVDTTNLITQAHTSTTSGS